MIYRHFSKPPGTLQSFFKTATRDTRSCHFMLFSFRFFPFPAEPFETKSCSGAGSFEGLGSGTQNPLASHPEKNLVLSLHDPLQGTVLLLFQPASAIL